MDELDDQKLILVFVGPSGSGKTTVGEELTKRGIPKLITTTTRKPRPGEKTGVDYYFCDAEEMNAAAFVEQTIYNGNLYGLTIKEVRDALEKHSVVHVSLDRNGVEAMKKAFPQETRIVYFDVPEEKIQQRMKKRGDSETKIRERLEFGRLSGEYAPPTGTHLVVQNENLDQTVQTIIRTFHLEETQMIPSGD